MPRSTAHHSEIKMFWGPKTSQRHQHAWYCSLWTDITINKQKLKYWLDKMFVRKLNSMWRARGVAMLVAVLWVLLTASPNKPWNAHEHRTNDRTLGILFINRTWMFKLSSRVPAAVNGDAIVCLIVSSKPDDSDWRRNWQCMDSNLLHVDGKRRQLL